MTLVDRIKQVLAHIKGEQAAQDAAIAELAARGRRVDGGGPDSVHAPGGGVNGGEP